MYAQHTRGWTKHFDFMAIDVLCLQVCFILGYWASVGFGNPYERDAYQYQAVVLTASQLIVMLFSKGYQGILRRKRFDELVAVLTYSAGILVLTLVYLFVVHHSATASRLQLGFTLLFYVVLDYLLRQLNKRRILRQKAGQKKSMVLITSTECLDQAMGRLGDPNNYHDYFISEVLLVDGEGLTDYDGTPVLPLSKDSLKYMSREWVDEVLVLQPEGVSLPAKLMDDLVEMGMTVNYSPSLMIDGRWPITEMREIGGYKVLTGGIRFISVGQAALKRLLDIVGGLVGCVLTGVLFLFVAPAICAKSPGPVFFAQERVGRNGKTFMMYKFRSMRLDAEEHKVDLLERNKVSDGMMFKMDDDPRIIGSEKKRADGSPGGIGNFIRRTSIDEFPQFFNVLKGDMSLVGTRPPTMDEWEKYDLGHRVRMNMKPGITGMWQVSGRSTITDFNEVVRLDRRYIEEWSIALDIKILLKTVVVVLRRSGAA